MATILILFAYLGLLLIVLGLIRLSMTIFGFKRLQALDTKFQLTLSKFGVSIETHYLGLACVVVGITMIVTPCILSGWLGEVGEVYGAQKQMETTSRLKKIPYTILEEEIRIDLRNRQEINLIHYVGSKLSKTEWSVRKVIKDIGEGVPKLHFRHATSGPGLRKIELPKGAKLRRVIKEESEVLYNPFADLLRGKAYEQIFTELLSRKGQMKSYYVIVPVSGGEGEEIWYKLEYNNAFQGRDFEWAGKAFDADCDVLTMHITFPDDKPFKSLETYKRTSGGGKPIPMSNSEIKASHGNHVLTWKIQNAKKGEKYYIKWEW